MVNLGPAAEQLPGYLSAFLTAMVVIAVDCNSALKKAVGRVPINVLRSPAIWFLCCGCGLIAALCFHFSYQSPLSEVVELKWHSSFSRGAAVGLAVLTILRSKFFNFKDTEIGGEYFYNAGRAEAVKRLWNEWTKLKERFTTDDILKKACGRKGFDDEIVEAIRERIKPFPDEKEKKLVEEQIVEVMKSKPSTPVDCSDPIWLRYYRTLIKLALDSVGANALAQFPFFPKS